VSGRHADLLERVTRAAEAAARSQGVELVELALRGSSVRRLLRVDIDRAGPRSVDLDDCQRVSAALGAALDADDTIEASYVLEVSSPGLDRPIRTADDFRRNTGRRVVVRTAPQPDGRREFHGVLTGVDGGILRLYETGGAELELPLDAVERVRQEVQF